MQNENNKDLFASSLPHQTCWSPRSEWPFKIWRRLHKYIYVIGNIWMCFAVRLRLTTRKVSKDVQVLSNCNEQCENRQVPLNRALCPRSDVLPSTARRPLFSQRCCYSMKTNSHDPAHTWKMWLNGYYSPPTSGSGAKRDSETTCICTHACLVQALSNRVSNKWVQ